MAAFRPDDDWYDRAEALGEHLEAEGEPLAFYDWTPESFAATGLRAELRVLDGLLDDIVAAA